MPVLDPPGGERAVAAGAAGVGVRPRLDRAPVVAGGDREGVDAVHDPLVVGGRAVRVGGGELVGVEHPLGHLRAVHAVARERRERDAHRGARQAPVGQVGEDAETRRTARDLLDHRRERLDQRVDGVGAHRVAGVEEEMHDDHGLTARAAHQPHLDVARAGAAPAEARRQLLGRG